MFDVTSWLDGTGPQGPRLVVKDVGLPVIDAEPLIAEEERITTMAVGGLGQRLRVATGMLTALAILVLAGVVINGWGVRGGPLVVVGVLGAVLIRVVYSTMLEGGLDPLESCIAGAGRVSFAGLLRRGEFLWENSVMVVEATGGERSLQVWFVRRDGHRVRMRFRRGMGTPGFQQLIMRWAWRGGAGADHAGQATVEREAVRSGDRTGSIDAS